ncbi:MAG: N-6 DNA methylase [Candidatus Hodarchaeales archaeon]
MKTNSILTMVISRRDLKIPIDLKKVFADIRNHLAGNFKGITQDNTLVEQVLFLLFCKIQDEQETAPNEPVRFQIEHPDNQALVTRINDIFLELKAKFNTILDASTDQLIIDERNLRVIVLQLQTFAISEAPRDAIGDAIEQILLPSLRGSQGQFFTPKNISLTMAQILNPLESELVIDPACGAGGFLTSTMSLNKEINNHNLYGIDKDEFLVKISKLHLALLNYSNAKIFCENSLETPENWSNRTQAHIKLKMFDVVLTNPPFGAKISITEQAILDKYELGHKWNSTDDLWIKNSQLRERQPPQILFIERSLQLLKPGGRMAIVLPEGIFGNTSDRYIISYLLENYTILAVISCSPVAFAPHTHIKTSLLFIEKTKQYNNYSIFFAVAKEVGHDKNGREIYRSDEFGNPILDQNREKIIADDLPIIVRNYQIFKKGNGLDYSSLGFILHRDDLVNNILIPAYYDPSVHKRLQTYNNKLGFTLISLGELVQNNIISITRGHEIGAKAYGTGTIPFVRTSDIINLEIDVDPLKQVSTDIYNKYKEKQDIRVGDILIVNDGTFLIGRTAMITDEQIIIQSHLNKLRITTENSLLDQYLLLWSLNTDIVQEQIKAKTFIQATISTLGDRLKEVVLVLPSDPDERKKISTEFRTIIEQKQKLKNRFKLLIKDI